jgi:Domain of Unknown Function (DUF1259)
MLTAQFALLEDEVNPVLTAALDSGLEVTGLGGSFLFERPRTLTLDVTAVGGFQKLASGFRKTLDQIRRVRASGKNPAISFSGLILPETSNISPGPVDAILSMRGSVTSGVYRATIGRKALLHGETIGRELGISSWIAFAGTNDRAIANGEFVATTDELQSVLKALRGKNIYITSIRNHIVGEHPQFLFVHFWGEGTALELARGLRYVLDVQVGTISPGSGAKI